MRREAPRRRSRERERERSTRDPIRGADVTRVGPASPPAPEGAVDGRARGGRAGRGDDSGARIGGSGDLLPCGGSRHPAVPSRRPCEPGLPDVPRQRAADGPHQPGLVPRVPPRGPGLRSVRGVPPGIEPGATLRRSSAPLVDVGGGGLPLPAVRSHRPRGRRVRSLPPGCPDAEPGSSVRRLSRGAPPRRGGLPGVPRGAAARRPHAGRAHDVLRRVELSRDRGKGAGRLRRRPEPVPVLPSGPAGPRARRTLHTLPSSRAARRAR